MNLTPEEEFSFYMADKCYICKKKFYKEKKKLYQSKRSLSLYWKI